MAITPKKNSSSTIVDFISAPHVDSNLRLPTPLHVRILKFKEYLGASTDQEAMRIIITRFLDEKGF